MMFHPRPGRNSKVCVHRLYSGGASGLLLSKELKESTMRRLSLPTIMGFCAIAVVLTPHLSRAATPSAEQALKLAPVQAGVDYRSSPVRKRPAKCKILAKKFDGHVGWIVESPDG